MRRSAHAAGVALLLFTCLAFLLPAPAGGQASSQPRSDILELVSQTAVVDPGGTLAIRLHVTGAPTGAQIRVVLRSRVPTRSDFKAAVEGRITRSAIGTPFVAPAVADAAGTVAINVSTHDLQTEGVYPVSIDLLSDRGSSLDSLLTFVTVMPVSREFGPLGVAIVLPVSGAPALAADGTTSLDPEAAQSVLSTATVLQAHPGLPLTIAPTADTVDALDASTTDELRKALAGRQLTTTPYASVPVAEWLAAGLGPELSREFDEGTSRIRDRLAAPDASTYVADEPLTPDAANALRDRGIRTMVLPENGLAPLDERVFNRTLTQPFNLTAVDGVQAAVADAALSAHAGETGDPIVDANHLVADLAVLYFDDPPAKRGAVVAFGQASVEPQFLDAVLTAIDPATNRIVQPMTLSSMFGFAARAGSRGETSGRGTPLTRTLTSAPESNLSAFATALHSTEADLDSYRGMVTTDNPRPGDFERRMLVAGASDFSASDQLAYLDDVRNAISGETAKVQPPPRQTINFTARDGVVSLTMRNTTGYPVKVFLRLQGDKLEFPGHENGIIDVTLTEETTRVSLNVRTRASGDSALDISVTSPDGHLVAGRTRVTVRSTAFSGVGIVLSIGAGAFLAVWWLRHAIAVRRERRRNMRHAAKG
jgi:hypothetical protein